MHPTKIYSILKDILSDITNRPRPEILAGMVLRAPPPGGLGFTDPGLRALAARLNVEFAARGHPISPPLVPSETQACVTVRDLFSLIRPRVT